MYVYIHKYKIKTKMSMGGSHFTCPIIMLILKVKINSLHTQFQFNSMLSFKLDVLKTQAPTTEKNAGYEFLSASIILHMYSTGQKKVTIAYF